MRLTYYELNFTIELKRGGLFSIILESPAIFEHFLVSLHGQLGKECSAFALSEDGKELELIKCCDLVISPFDLTFAKKEISKKLFAELEAAAQEQELVSELSEIYGSLFGVLEKLRFAADYEIEYNSDFAVSDILKNCGVHLTDPAGLYVEKLIDYMIVMHKLLKKELFIIANCSGYLDEEDYEHIEKAVAHYDLCIVFVENRQLRLPKIKKEYIIDKDLCEIH